MLLFSKFKKYLPLTSPKKAGRRRLMKSIDVLRLVLQLLNSNMKQKTLAQFFRIVPSSVCLYVNLGLNQLLLVLKNMLNIQVTWPSPIQMKEYSLLIAKREPLLTNTLGFVDGLNLPVHESSDFETQNAYHNGWLSGCLVSNVFVFSPTGCIIYAAINKTGSWHDSQVARSLYDKLRFDTPQEFDVLADSAFAYSDDLSKHILAVERFSHGQINH